MFTTRISAYLAAAGLAAGGFLAVAAAPAASASTGPVIYTTNAAGYQASGRDFRFITSTITVPDWFSNVLYPQSYIQLSEGSLNNLVSQSGDQFVRAGIEPCVLAKVFGSTCTPGDWVAFVSEYNNSLNFPVFQHFTDLAGVQAGDGVNFSVYFDQAGNELHFTITPPVTSGPEQFYKTNAHGPLFDHAAAVNDFLATTGKPVPLPPGFNPIKVNSFYQGALTTYSGLRGSLTSPGWATSEVQATSNGLQPPSGALRVDPGALFTDGLSANGAKRADDAFGPVTVVG